MDADVSQPIQSILMTADAVGGVWTYALTLAEALREHGIAIHLATMGEPLSMDQWHQAQSIQNLFVVESSFRLEWMDDPWDDVKRAGDWLLDLEQKVDPDLIHLNGYAHGSLSWRHPVAVVAHSCVLSWWRAVKGEEAPENWEHYRDMVRRGLLAADAIIAPSHAMLSELRRCYGPLHSGTVIPNACSTEAYGPGPKEPIVFSAGRLWDDAKNIRALDSIAGELDWPVYVAGSGYGGQSSRCLGRLSADEMRGWYSRAAIYALPARYEPFGLSVLEAALSGCALVLGDIPSLRENWSGAALFVDPDDTNALRQSLQALIANSEIRSDLARRARQRALEFTPSRMAESYMEAYQAILQSQCV